MKQKEKRFIKVALLLGIGTCLLCLVLMAFQPRDSHRNLHYVAWKWGLASYDKDMVCNVMRFDGSFRVSLVGIDEQSFLRKFPDTFYRLKRQVAWAREDETIYTDIFDGAQPSDYRAAQGWVAIFRNGKLRELTLQKGP